jgi:hypothetical protein
MALVHAIRGPSSPYYNQSSRRTRDRIEATSLDPIDPIDPNDPNKHRERKKGEQCSFHQGITAGMGWLRVGLPAGGLAGWQAGIALG